MFRKFLKGAKGGAATKPAPDAIGAELRHRLRILCRVRNKLTAVVSQGTIVDATIIAAPSSTKNSKGERDPEMHQTKKGNQWYFGMKAHIGADADSGAVHSVIGLPPTSPT